MSFEDENQMAALEKEAEEGRCFQPGGEEGNWGSSVSLQLSNE